MITRIEDKLYVLKNYVSNVVLNKTIKVLEVLGKYQPLISIFPVYNTDIQIEFTYNDYYIEIIVDSLIYEIYIEKDDIEILNKGYYNYTDVVKQINNILG